MRGLLDGDLLDGQHEVTTLLRPERFARPVAVNDMPALSAEMLRLCQVWGGAGQPLLPVRDRQVPTAYRRLLMTEQVDAVGGLQDIEVDLPRRVGRRRPFDYPVALVVSGRPADSYRPVRVAELGPDDPWKPVYEAVLGAWPEVPDPDLGKAADLREDLRFEEILPVERQQVQGSLDDLVGRAADPAVLSPRQLSNVFLASGMLPNSYLVAPTSVLPRPGYLRTVAGPNLVVVVTPGCVEDVALLWNLRAAHGDGRVLPIGIPVDQVTAEALTELQSPGRATMFGWRGGACHLVSASLSLPELVSLADLAPSTVAAAYEDLLTFGPAPGRPRSQVAVWTAGRARVSPLTEGDEEVLAPTRAAFRHPGLVLDVTVADNLLPADAAMRGDRHSARFQAGAAQVAVSESREHGTVGVAWPPTWTSLAAVARGHGLTPSPSVPGTAAVTLVRALGGVREIATLKHPPLTDLLYRMAESSGMTWWKKRWADVHRQYVDAGGDPDRLDRTALLLGRDDPVVAPAGEGRAVDFREFVRAVGNEQAAVRWVDWAERRHLLVRGTNVDCAACGTRTWLPMASLPPPVGCPGCGRQIDRPYPARHLAFTYRLGEPLRRVLEHDSLGHVLALHWLVALFDGHGLVGAHPGVTFTGTDGKVVGEADVVLLFADGSLVPVEVKRRAAGTDGRTVELLGSLSDALAAPYDVLAVTQPARDCPGLAGLRRDLPGRPRLLLTDDNLYEQNVFWAMGDDPFAWRPRTPEDDAERAREFRDRLANHDPDEPWDWVSADLLGPDPD